MSTRLARLTPFDHSNLRLETVAAPFHFGALAIVDGGPLLDPSGRLRLDEIRSRIERRLGRVPELRRRVYFPGLLRARAISVEDGEFDIRHHVRRAKVEAPGGETELLAAVARLDGSLLDRTHPLWELWFLSSLSDHRVGVFLKVHHSVADGMAAVAIMTLLFDLETDSPEEEPTPWSPVPIPNSWQLLTDSISTKLWALERASKMLLHPVRAMGAARELSSDLRLMLRRHPGAPRTSINQAVRPGRRVRFIRLELAAMKQQGHAAGATVNDVILDLVSGGLQKLLAARGESVSAQLKASVAVSLRSQEDAADLGNRVGVIVVPLPVFEPDARRRLTMITAATGAAKAEQHPGTVSALVGWLAAMPVAQMLMAHQRSVNVFTTNLAGPPVMVSVLGAGIRDVIPVIQIAGNVTMAFCAFSYAGRVNLVVTADASAVPDKDCRGGGHAASLARAAGRGARAGRSQAGREQRGRVSLAPL